MLPGVDLEQLLLTIGYVGLAAIIFAESGLFFGFFLPGDTLLITAGVLSSARPDIFSIWIVIFVCFIAAVTGDAVGYTFGRRVGGRLYERPDSRWFKRSHLVAAEEFYERHGGKTIVMARFLPFVRTFAPIVAGTARMRYPRFAVFNFTGAFLWAVGLPLAGYLLGEAMGEELDRWLLVVLAVVFVLSVLPTAIHLLRHNRAEISARLRSLARRGNEVPGTERNEPGRPPGGS
ncbi:MAG TPA: VTT domain-containing protein [Candidatus Limnocylindrales bacterium]|nr:VTT domain-containing protein [Candidatus Limnocylindrales bacterium]